MNLLGLKNSNKHSTLTLDKINTRLRMAIKEKDIKLTIIQEHSESRIVSYLHKKRKKYDHIIISPGVWNINGYLIRETLSIINLPLSIISSNEYKFSIFNDIIDKTDIIIDNDYINGYLKILESL